MKDLSFTLVGLFEMLVLCLLGKGGVRCGVFFQEDDSQKDLCKRSRVGWEGALGED